MILRPARAKETSSYTLAVAIPAIAQIIIPGVLPFSLVVSAGLVLRAEINRARSKYKMNNEELSYEAGILKKDRASVKIRDIVKLNVKQGFFERILRYGHVEVETKSTPLMISNVRSPHVIAQRIKELQKDREV